jgi:hypothetical protein
MLELNVTGIEEFGDSPRARATALSKKAGTTISAKETLLRSATDEATSLGLSSIEIISPQSKISRSQRSA